MNPQLTTLQRPITIRPFSYGGLSQVGNHVIPSEAKPEAQHVAFSPPLAPSSGSLVLCHLRVFSLEHDRAPARLSPHLK